MRQFVATDGRDIVAALTAGRAGGRNRRASSGSRSSKNT
jgi:hypothetical protein